MQHDALPMVPASCGLDGPGLQRQLARYRRAGAEASIIERTRRRLVITVSDEVSNELVDELVAIERRCCPFFELDWRPDRRQLVLAVDGADREQALEALAAALGIPAQSSGAGPGGPNSLCA